MDVESRLAAIEGQLAELNSRAEPPPPATSEDAFWALGGLRERAAELEGGAVLFTGTVDLQPGEHYEWQQGHPVGDLLAEDWTDRARTLAALGHPVRLLLLRRMLEGVRTASELAEDEGLGTTGQLYHHLRQLVSAGWLRSSARGQYSVPAERIVPLLVTIAASRH